MSDALYNVIKRIVEQVLEQEPRPRRGVVASINPTTMQARVQIPNANSPSGLSLTGWLPIASPCIGAGWGIMAAPPIGAQVLVMPMDGSGDASVLWGGHWSLPQQPPADYPVGEIWLFHQTGAVLKVNNAGGWVGQDQKGAIVTADGNGAVKAQDQAGATFDLPNTGAAKIADAAGDTFIMNAGTATLNAALNVTGPITSNVDVAGPSGITLETHIHGVTTAPGDTTAPMS